jgi:hypothetical protein
MHRKTMGVNEHLFDPKEKVKAKATMHGNSMISQPGNDLMVNLSDAFLNLPYGLV